jgi:hypothetical protein
MLRSLAVDLSGVAHALDPALPPPDGVAFDPGNQGEHSTGAHHPITLKAPFFDHRGSPPGGVGDVAERGFHMLISPVREYLDWAFRGGKFIGRACQIT